MTYTTLNPLKNICLITDKQLTDHDYSTYLTKSEISSLSNKPNHKKHQSLMGRLAVKEAVRNFTDARKVPYHEIEIFKEPSGLPKYKLHGFEQRPKVSISHCKNMAIGGIAPDTIGYGVDVEAVRVFSEDFFRSFATDLEWSKYKQLADKNKKIFPTLLWSIKEATLKALGTGLRVHPKNVSVQLSDQLLIQEVIIMKRNITVKPAWTLFNNSYIIVSIEIYEKSRNGVD